jgi:porin
VNPTLLGAIGGYYNSVCGLTLTLAPTRNTYLSYGFYDGNVILGIQTGMTGPHFNGYYFNIWEAGLDWVIADKYSGQFGAGLWYQSGLVQRPNVSQDGMGGFYLLGSQRIWSKSANTAGADSAGHGKSATLVGPINARRPSISTFAQFGVNNAEVLPINQYFEMGFTGFALVPGRPADSLVSAWHGHGSTPRPSTGRAN